jgi:acetyltransferase-like isoleucine patch superfamily enzyme
MHDLAEWGVAVVAEGVTVGPGAKVAPLAMVTQDVPAGETAPAAKKEE